MGIDMRIMGTDVPNMGTGAAAALVRFHHHLLRRRLLPRCALTLRSDGQSSAPGRDSGTTFASKACEILFGKVNSIGFCIAVFLFFGFVIFFGLFHFVLSYYY
jgi:hypothetical protein